MMNSFILTLVAETKQREMNREIENMLLASQARRMKSDKVGWVRRIMTGLRMRMMKLEIVFPRFIDGNAS